MTDQKVSISSKSMTGKLDNQSYNVITIMGGGRDWFQSMYYSTNNPETLLGVVQEEIVFGGKEYVYVKLDEESLNILVRDYAKSPYIRKDGSYNEGHVRGEITSIKDVYGCLSSGVILFPKKSVKKVVS
jgi:hypothetical protein